MAAPLPGPIVFDLSVRERAAIRAEYLSLNGGIGNVAAAVLLTSAVVQAIGPSFRLYRLRGHDPLDWILLALCMMLLALWVAFVFSKTRSLRFFVRAEAGTVVIFEAFGLSIERTNRRGARVARTLPYYRIRKVQLLPHAIVIASRWRPVLIVPTSALPNGAAEYMSFFDDRLTGKAMLARSPGSPATVVNTASFGP